MRANNDESPVYAVLSERWGAASFREGQKEAIDAVLARKDCLLVLPTGGGKSLCYQLPALLVKGTVIVVSPLIALMLDQVGDLNSRGISAVSLGGQLNSTYINQVLRKCSQGEIKFLYLSPERLQQPRIREFLRKEEIAYLVVDEAHCISQWGHQFRPEYREIVRVFERERDISIIAVTATATPRVQSDICDNLKLINPIRLVHSHDRPNIFWSVVKEQSRKHWMVSYYSSYKGSGIVYVSTRKNAEGVARYLKQNGVSCEFYHAGMNARDRLFIQESFLRSRFQVMVATSAFGMGIDKADVRVVIHYDLPTSFEEYIQQAGRAGRDGLASSAILLFDEKAVAMQKGRARKKGERWQRVRSLLGYHRRGPSAKRNLIQLEKYAGIRTCRRRDILFYFGENATGKCGGCDNCNSRRGASKQLSSELKKQRLRFLESEGMLVQKEVGFLSEV